MKKVDVTQPILWHESYAIGIPLIDSQHRRLVEMAEGLRLAIAEEAHLPSQQQPPSPPSSRNATTLVVKVLKGLVQYCSDHFECEELLMQAVRFPSYSAHVSLHRQFAHQTVRWLDDFQAERLDAHDVLETILEWLIHHIREKDTGITKYCKSKSIDCDLFVTVSDVIPKEEAMPIWTLPLEIGLAIACLPMLGYCAFLVFFVTATDYNPWLRLLIGALLDAFCCFGLIYYVRRAVGDRTQALHLTHARQLADNLFAAEIAQRISVMDLSDIDTLFTSEDVSPLVSNLRDIVEHVRIYLPYIPAAVLAMVRGDQQQQHSVVPVHRKSIVHRNSDRTADLSSQAVVPPRPSSFRGSRRSPSILGPKDQLFTSIPPMAGMESPRQSDVDDSRVLMMGCSRETSSVVMNEFSSNSGLPGSTAAAAAAIGNPLNSSSLTRGLLPHPLASPIAGEEPYTSSNESIRRPDCTGRSGSVSFAPQVNNHNHHHAERSRQMSLTFRKASMASSSPSPASSPSPSPPGRRDSRHASISVVAFAPKTKNLLSTWLTRKMVSVMVADLTGFVELSQSLPVEELLAMHSAYIALVESVSAATRGNIMVVLGDRVIVSWNGASTVADYAPQACAAALNLQEEFKNESLLESQKCKVAVATGMASVGNLGSKSLLSFAIVGQVTLIASALCKLNGLWQTDVLICSNTWRNAREFYMAKIITPFDLLSSTATNSTFADVPAVSSVDDPALGPSCSQVVGAVPTTASSWPSHHDQFPPGSVSPTHSQLGSPRGFRAGPSRVASFFSRISSGGAGSDGRRRLYALELKQALPRSETTEEGEWMYALDSVDDPFQEYNRSVLNLFFGSYEKGKHGLQTHVNSHPDDVVAQSLLQKCEEIGAFGCRAFNWLYGWQEERTAQPMAAAGTT